MQSRRGRGAATDRDGAGAHGPKRRRWLAVLGTVLVLALAGVVAARTVDLDATVAALRGADPLLLVAAVAAYAASWPLRGRRYGDVLAPMDRRLDSGFLTLAVLLSQTANLVLPARAGDGLRAYVCKRRRNVSYATGAASLTVERCFDLLALGAIGTAALAALAVTDGTAVRELVRGAAGPALAAVRSTVPGFESPLVVASGVEVTAVEAAVLGVAAVGIVVSALLCATLVLGVGRRRLSHATERLGATIAAWLPTRVVAGVRTAAADLAALTAQPRSLAVVGAGSVAIWLLDAATAVLVLAAVSSASVGAVLAVGTLAVVAGNLAKVLPLTQGGIGLYEGAFVATVVAVSPVGAAVALAAAVLDHALKNGVTLVGGVLAGALLQISPTAAPSGDAG